MTLQISLGQDEKVLWAGRPDPRRAPRGDYVIAFLPATLTFALLVLFAVDAVRRGLYPELLVVAVLAFPVYFPFVYLGSGLWYLDERHRKRHVEYVLTDQRACIVTARRIIEVPRGEWRIAIYTSPRRRYVQVAFRDVWHWNFANGYSRWCFTSPTFSDVPAESQIIDKLKRLDDVRVSSALRRAGL